MRTWTVAKHLWLTREMCFRFCPEHQAYEFELGGGKLLTVTRQLLLVHVSFKTFTVAIARLLEKARTGRGRSTHTKRVGTREVR